MSGRVAVVWGGPSSEAAVSGRSGRNVFASLSRIRQDVLLLEYGEDLGRRLREEEVAEVFLMMHGNPGEDGSVQGCLELLGIPYTYSGVLTSAVCMNKKKTKEYLSFHGLPVLRDILVTGRNAAEAAEVIERDLGWPAVIKPNAEGSSVGVRLVADADECRFAVAEGVRLYGELLAESFAPGRELTIGVVEEADRSLRALPVLELKPKNAFYDYEAKYTEGMTDFLVPAPLPGEVAESIRETAARAAGVLGCRSAVRVDMILGPQGFHILEVNTIPGMTATSDLPKAAEADGISFDRLVEKILATASLKASGVAS